MALIKCPECGTEVSDKAIQCPRCAYPIANLKTEGIVYVKLGVVRAPICTYTHRVIIQGQGGSILWEGKSGQIAEFRVDKHTPVHVVYKSMGLSSNGFSYECDGVIDPSRGNRYAVTYLDGLFKGRFEFQRVDVIDSE